jgi:hypothetical protein
MTVVAALVCILVAVVPTLSRVTRYLWHHMYRRYWCCNCLHNVALVKPALRCSVGGNLCQEHDCYLPMLYDAYGSYARLTQQVCAYLYYCFVYAY